MSFEAFCISHGLIVPHIYADEKIKRCGTEEHPRSKNGAYYFDGQKGFIFRWDREARPIWWNDQNARPWTDEEKRAWAERKRAAEREKEQGYLKAAEKAATMIRTSKIDTHPYLNNKGFNIPSMVTPELELIVPMRDFWSNDLVGAQLIKFDTKERKFNKKMIYGMKAKGAIFRLGNKNSETWLVEGYATGLTVEKALKTLRINSNVVVCFSANNMRYVAERLRGERYCFADNDVSGVGEKAAIDAGAKYCMSDVIGEDANDLYVREGIFAVCKKIIEVRA